MAIHLDDYRAVAPAGIGDSLNDLPMLEVVDRPFLVERGTGGYEEGTEPLPGAQFCPSEVLRARK